MLSSDLECCSCDDCGKPMSLMDYYNQDGVCIACFEKWMDEVDANETTTV